MCAMAVAPREAPRNSAPRARRRPGAALYRVLAEPAGRQDPGGALPHRTSPRGRPPGRRLRSRRRDAATGGLPARARVGRRHLRHSRPDGAVRRIDRGQRGAQGHRCRLSRVRAVLRHRAQDRPVRGGAPPRHRAGDPVHDRPRSQGGEGLFAAAALVSGNLAAARAQPHRRQGPALRRRLPAREHARGVAGNLGTRAAAARADQSPRLLVRRVPAAPARRHSPVAQGPGRTPGLDQTGSFPAPRNRALSHLRAEFYRDCGEYAHPAQSFRGAHLREPGIQSAVPPGFRVRREAAPRNDRASFHATPLNNP